VTIRIIHFAIAVCLLQLPLAAQAQKAPDHFRVELLYQAPEIEHPSVVTCDDHGNLFVGEDPMDMRGPTTKEFDRVLYIQFDEHGQPIRKTVFCDGLSAVFGLVWHDGALYVMHAPHYSMFQDTNGDGVADVRKDLAEGFGPPAGVFGFNDHIVTGTRIGLDGLIYVSVGDKGVPLARGADGGTISLEGGGVVRMCPDGTRLEVFSSGTRNHLDVAMDSLDNIFTYDNTDDGLGWWTRFTNHIPTGYYGYPYDYHPHPERHLPRISEHGGGSPVGAACYREAAWPAKYRDSAFHCEWGKRKIQRFAPRKSGATFTAEVEDFIVADGAGEFRPQDLCFSPDGRYMYIADWNYGGWTRPDVVGRIYRVSYTGGDVPLEPERAADADLLDRQIAALAHPAHSERMRAQQALVRIGEPAVASLTTLLATSNDKLAKTHAIWALHAIAERTPAVDPAALWTQAIQDADADVRAQAARAIGQRFATRNLYTIAASQSPAARPNALKLPNRDAAIMALEARLADDDPLVRMWAAVALGQIADHRSVKPLFAALGAPDAFARFAMIQALRSINHWGYAEEFINSPDPRVREGALLAMTDVYSEDALSVLIRAAFAGQDPQLRPKALGAVGEVLYQAAPYQEGWWGTQPARAKFSRPKDCEWVGTIIAQSALVAGVEHADPALRLAAAVALRATGSKNAAELLRRLLADSDAAVRREAILAAGELKDEDSITGLIDAAADTSASDALRQAAVQSIMAIGSADAVERLIGIVARPETSDELAVVAMQALAQMKAAAAGPAVLGRLANGSAAARAQAITAYTEIVGASGAPAIAEHLDDAEVVVRQACLTALGKLHARDYVPQIISAAGDAALRYDVIAALAHMPDRRAVPLLIDGLVDKNADLREACRAALVSLGRALDDDLVLLHERGELSGLARAALKCIVGEPTPITQWNLMGAWPKAQRPSFDPAAAPDTNQRVTLDDRALTWHKAASAKEGGRIRLNGLNPDNDAWAIAHAIVASPTATTSEALIGSDDQLTLYVNGTQVYQYDTSRGWSPNQDSVPIELAAGENHIWVLAGNDSGPWEFSVAIKQRDPRLAFLDDVAPPATDPARYREHALAEAGDASRGRALFADRQGVACVKCHAVGGDGGGQVGPDLAGIGAKYPREELIRSVLEPSNRILSGYQLSVVVTSAGEILQGIIKSDAADAIDLLDAEGRVRRVAAADVDERETQNISMMPTGLKDGLTPAEFTDIIAYLESLRSAPGAK
jgi:putative membrane-bound dehydrogenase-like protein